MPPNAGQEPNGKDTGSVASQFEQFWRVFPPGRKQAKGATRDLFVCIATGKHKTRRATPEEMIAGAERYAASKPDPEVHADAYDLAE